VGLWAGLVTASTIVFTMSAARAATVDSALTFFTTLAFLLFVIGWRKGAGFGVQGSGNGEQGRKSSNQQFPLSYAIASYACIGVAVLGKGPVGMLLPLAAMGLFLLAINGWQSFFRSAWWMRPFTIIALIAVVALPWYVAVGCQTSWEWPKQFIRDFCLRPFQTPIQGHGDATTAIVSVLYYFYQVPAILFGFFPWSVFLGPTLVDTVRRLREGKKRNGEKGKQFSTLNKPLAASQPFPSDAPTSEAARWRVGILLALCWFGVWFVFWSICKTKLLHYLLPAYPALALLTACFIDRWLAAEKGSDPICRNGPSGAEHKWGLTPFPPPWAFRNAWISTIFVGVGIMIAIPLLAPKYLPGEALLGSLGLLLVLGGAWCWRKTSRNQYHDAAVAFAITSVAFLTAVFGFATLRVDRFQNAKPMMAAICADEEGGVKLQSPIATYRFFRWSTVFYAGKPVTACDNEADGRSAQQELAAFLAQPTRSYVITTDEYEPEIKKAFGDRLKVIHREPQFLADGEMVIFRHGD
jgi:4-amino-4-deoxy-L-arabinose transferase-like glycosyltransferase